MAANAMMANRPPSRRIAFANGLTGRFGMRFHPQICANSDPSKQDIKANVFVTEILSGNGLYPCPSLLMHL